MVSTQNITIIMVSVKNITPPGPWAPAGIFPGGGGQTFGGAPKKSVKGGPHIFFRQALKYAYRGGGGVSFDARRIFF